MRRTFRPLTAAEQDVAAQNLWVVESFLRQQRLPPTSLIPPKLERPIALMPLRKNMPHPDHSDWELTTCPECGKECWKMGETAKITERYFPVVRFLCTECALRGGGKEDTTT